MSKTMYLIRNADRVGNQLTERGIVEAREFGKTLRDQSYTLIYSAIPWSWETVWHIIPTLEFVHVQGKEKGLSPDRLFEEMFTPEINNLMKEKQIPAAAAIGEIFDREQVGRWETRLAEGIGQIFDGLPPASFCIAIGHDPYIQLAVRGLGGDIPGDMVRLPSLSGFRINQGNGGRIDIQPFRWPAETP